MVKGNSRQVIVVKSPDTKLFEQAIFLLKENAVERSGITEAQLLEEARRAADGYMLRKAQKKLPKRAPPLFWFLAGNGCIGLLWALTLLF